MRKRLIVKTKLYRQKLHHSTNVRIKPEDIRPQIVTQGYNPATDPVMKRLDEKLQKIG